MASSPTSCSVRARPRRPPPNCVCSSNSAHRRPTLVASDNELAVAGFDDLGRWGTQIDHFREIRASKAITREQLAGLLTRYFPQLTEFRQSPEILTDVEGSWAESAIQTVVGAGLLDPMANHTFQPTRTVSRGEFAVAVARLTRLLGVSPADRLADNPAGRGSRQYPLPGTPASPELWAAASRQCRKLQRRRAGRW